MGNPLDSEPELLPFVDPETQRLFRDRVLAADDEQARLAELRARLAAWRASLKPTREQLLQVTHEENRMHARLEGGNQQFWDGLDAEWRRKQKPDSPQWNIPQEPSPNKPEQQRYEPAFSSLYWMEQNKVLSEREQLKKNLKNLEIEPEANEPKDLRDEEPKSVDLADIIEHGEDSLSSDEDDHRSISDVSTSTFRAVVVFLRKFAALGGAFLLAACWTMIQIDEYALALILLVIGMGAFSSQIYDWMGIEKHGNATRTLKIIASFLIAISLVFFGAVILKKKGNKAWTNLSSIGQISKQTTYCVFIADPSGIRTTYPLSVLVYGKEPMLDVTATIQPIRDGSTPNDIRQLPLDGGTLLAGAHSIRFAIPPGKYVIQVWSRSGLITEALELQIIDGSIVQTVDVWGDGKQLYVLDAKGNVKNTFLKNSDF